MELYPTKLERSGTNQLVIEWSDRSRRLYTARELRDGCPCATCREKASKPAPATTGLMSLPIVTASDMQPLVIQGMQPVGNYAYSIRFSDGHDTGIYSFELLQSLGKEVAA